MRIIGTITNNSWAMPYTINTPNSNLMNIFVVYTFLAFILIGCRLNRMQFRLYFGCHPS